MVPPLLDLGLFEISNGPSKGGGLDFGLSGKSKVPSKGGGLDFGLSGKSKVPSMQATIPLKTLRIMMELPKIARSLRSRGPP